jgi:SAM-dependent methyltransferase
MKTVKSPVKAPKSSAKTKVDLGPASKNPTAILEYWNKEDVESMYDKNLLNSEINLIKAWIPRDAKLLDAGCGEGEGTLQYSRIAAVVHAADFSTTRLKKAAKLLGNASHVKFQQIDFRKDYKLDSGYDVAITQRFLINLMEWDLQQRTITNLVNALKPGGRLLMFEGSQQGVNELNRFRAAGGLPPIPIKWHNRFFDDNEVEQFVAKNGWKLRAVQGVGTYILLTRGIRPMLDSNLNWDCEFNRIAASPAMNELRAIDSVRFSRLKLWVIER